MISVERDQRVLHVKLNIPPVNVLDTAACNRLVEELYKASNDHSLAAVLISGEGKCFSAGASVEEHKQEHAEAMITALTDACKSLYNMPVPTVAMVHGACFGGAFELALYCDFITADPGATFGVPEVMLAFFPPLACSALPGIVGRQNAANLIFTGESISAERAQQMGAVQKILAKDEWGTIARRFNKTSAPVLRLAKEALRMSLHDEDDRFASDITRHLFLDRLYQLDDVNEGISSFNEKRKPNWSHA